MCDVYAGQLEDVGEVTKASTYLVAIKKINEAAMLLLKNNLFREALAVVKSQSEQNDELILEITKKWAEYNVLHGHPKEATHWLEYHNESNINYCNYLYYLLNYFLVT